MLEPTSQPGHSVACLLPEATRQRLWAQLRQGAQPDAGARCRARTRGPVLMAENILEVRDVVKHFPITQGIIFQRQVGAVQAVDGVSLST